MISRSMLLSKFRGTFMGGLMGDCLGSPFERESPTATQINLYFSQLFDPGLKVPYKPYTDDTAMTKALAESIIEHKGINPQELAKKFTTVYFAEPKRGYGASVHDVFVNLRISGFDDPFYAAQRQFGGEGSFGNGAAMRAAPVALFAYNDVDSIVSLTSTMSRITHTHPHAVQGACLQALAVREALLLDPTKQLNPLAFIQILQEHLSKLEKEIDQPDWFINEDDQTSFKKKLQTMKEFFERKKTPSYEEVQERLGVDVAAVNSVPTAIYAFLQAINKIPYLEFESQFVRTISYAISLGGDTDTIGSMAGSICGAFLGYDAIPHQLQRHCEKSKELLQLAEKLCAVEESGSKISQVS